MGRKLIPPTTKGVDMSELQIPGQTMLEDNRTHKNRFNIRSETSDNLYVVAQSKSSGDWQCSCKGWIRWRKCKHLTALMPILIAAEQQQSGKEPTRVIAAPKKVEPKPEPKPTPKAAPKPAPAPAPVVEEESPIRKLRAKAEPEKASVDEQKILEYALEHLCATFSPAVAKDLGLSDKELQKYVISKIGRKLFSRTY